MDNALNILLNLHEVINDDHIAPATRATVFDDARQLAWTGWRLLPDNPLLRAVVVAACTIECIDAAVGAHWNEGLILLAISELDARLYGEWGDEDDG